MRDDFREYENGVADVLSFLLGDAATVERNVRVPSRRGRGTRQVDVLIRGQVFGMADVTLAVDCKLWSRKITVADVDRFVGFIADVGADLGLLMAASGYTAAAKSRLASERGTRAEVITLSELSAWSPRGTRHISLRISASEAGRVAALLRARGLRVRPDAELGTSDDEIVLTAFGHFGGHDTGDEVMQRAQAALAAAGLKFDTASSGVSIGGGTPGHRWLEVTDRSGKGLCLKVLASTEAEVDRELQQVAATLGVARQALDVQRPEGWPATGLFGLTR